MQGREAGKQWLRQPGDPGAWRRVRGLGFRFRVSGLGRAWSVGMGFGDGGFRNAS